MDEEEIAYKAKQQAGMLVDDWWLEQQIDIENRCESEEGNG